MIKRWLLRKIDKYPVISFDIFDTLVERNTLNPSEIFSRTAKKHMSDEQVQIFVNKRVNAEKKARELRGDREVTLDEIYCQLSLEYGELASELLKTEIAEEIEACHIKVQTRDIYNKAIDVADKVFLISDMYLSKEVIGKILEKCDIAGYNKLYISNEYRVNKISGELFQIVKTENSISNEHWLHFGDSLKADYLGARKIGIDAVMVSRKNRIKRMLHKCL